MSLISIARDRLVERIGVPIINRSILEPYGKVTNLSVDSSAKSAEVTVELKGESEPIHVDISRYELIETNGRTILFIRAIRISREWMDNAAAEFLVNRPLKIPPDLAGKLRRIL